jgi:DNA polymerase-3 subunit alpha
LELGTGCLVVTDHGTMQACRHVYDSAKKAGLTPILGVEAYFRDDNCPILLAGGITDIKEYSKYFHITLHAMDEEAYYALVGVLSDACLNRMERHGSEEKPLFNWADLEKLSKFNITFTTGCLIGMVQRHMINGRPDLAEAYYTKLKEIVRPGNLYVEVFPHKTDKNWVAGVFIELENGQKARYYEGKKLKIDGVEIDAKTAAKKLKFDGSSLNVLQEVKNYRVWEVPTCGTGTIKSIKHVEDFIENDCIPGATDSDSQKWTNKAMLELAAKHGEPVLVSDDAHFATANEKVLQDVRLMAGGGSWRFYASYHRHTSEEAFEYFKSVMDIPESTFGGWVENNVKWSERFKRFSLTSKAQLPVSFYPSDSLRHTKALIDKVGRMEWSNPEWTARLRAEIDMLHANGVQDLLPYFFIDEEVCELYEKSGFLTGPGRGSAAGLLLSYLLGITHVDPLRYQLSMERFLTKDRIKNGKWPDIDQDLPSRHLLIDEDDPNKGWLKDRFGDHIAQISTDTKLKIRSSILDVARVKLGHVPPELAKLAHSIEAAPQGVEDSDFVFGYEGAGGFVEGTINTDPALKEYVQAYPTHWPIVQRLLGLPRQKSRHACAFAILNSPVKNTIPLTRINGHVVTQYTAKSVEASGGLKMDFLVINILNDISHAIRLIQDRNPEAMATNKLTTSKRVPKIRQIPQNGMLLDIWDLPSDQAVFNDVAEGKTETVFQFNTNTARGYLRLFNHDADGDGKKGIRSVEDMAAFTALGRPGPLDAYVEDAEGNKHNMLVEYANRAKGVGAVNPIKALDDLLPETHGVIVYQEQLQKIYQVVGKTTAVEADEFRVHIGKKYEKYEKFRLSDRDTFLKGATEAVGAEVAQQIWDQMYTFGQYGFNKSVDGDTILTLTDGISKPIKEMVPGDRVSGISENGTEIETEVLALHDHGELDGYEVEFEDGYKVVCSIDHKFLTKNGMKPLWKILENNEEILSTKEGLQPKRGAGLVDAE